MVAVGILCVPLLDETEQTVTQPMDHCTSHFHLIAELSLIVILISV